MLKSPAPTGDPVLDIGAGTGYNAALIKHLVGPGGRVTTVDLETAFARRARRSLATAGYAARVVVGDGRDGWGQGAPYDRIIVTASAGDVYRPWLDQLVDGGLVEMPLRLSKGLRYQVVATFERHGELLSSTAAMAGFFMSLRGAVPDGTESSSRALSATAGGSRRVLASLQGPYLERLSAQRWRRALATLLGPGRTIARLAKAGGLVTYLLLRGRGPVCYCVVDGYWGAAVLAENGSSIATVTRDFGGAGRIQRYGNDSALGLLDRYRDEWLERGSPTARDLRLAVSFGRTAPGRSWRRLLLGTSVVTINWRRTSPPAPSR